MVYTDSAWPPTIGVFNIWLKIKCSIFIIFAIGFMIVGGDYVYADDRLIETRYCGEPERAANGKIKRSNAVKREFERIYPLPLMYHRNDWAIDHVIPLAVGGCDDIHNLQWLPKIIKTCANSGCKDRWERIIYKRSN